VRRAHPVVVYDDAGSQSAARAWWLLRWAGHRPVQVLDGGLAVWTAAGGRLEIGTPPPGREGDVEVHPGGLPAVGTAEVAGRPPGRILIDSRAGERFRGEEEPIDPVAGHIPGAINLPTAGNLDGDGRFLPPGALRARFEAAGLGDQAPIVYCGSGVTAAHQLLAMELAGLAGVLYPPSWSGWVSDPGRPVATGS
jgi:thiosulfate/3-mercaptopyruvate sulfurtransferase